MTAAEQGFLGELEVTESVPGQASAAGPATTLAKPQARRPVAPQKQWMSVQQALRQAAALFSAGRLREAEILARQIAEARPKYPDAHNILGVAAHRLGRTEEGIRHIKQAIKLSPRHANFHANLGEMQRQVGRLDAALIALNKAIELNPQLPQAWNNIGIVHFDKREFAKAEQAYRRALAADPNYAEAHNNLGNALRALGRLDESIAQYERAIELRNAYPEAYNNMATVLRDQLLFEQAEVAYRRALALRPSYIEAANNLAELLAVQNKSDEALQILTNLLQQQPNNLTALVNIARAHLARRNLGYAEKALKRALAIDPDHAGALAVYGELCHEADLHEQAVTYLRKAVEHNPNHVEAWNFLGIAEKSMGRMDKAREAFTRALTLQPGAIGAYTNLVDIETFTPDHPILAAMEKQLANASDPEDERFMVLHFSLGKAYDDIGDYDRAARHFQIGTRLKRQQVKYQEAAVMAFFARIRELFTADFLASNAFEGDPSDRPVFIVGFPRSGSTLTEQIIASHPEAHGAGEVKYLYDALGRLRQTYPNLPRYPDIVEQMKPVHFAAVAKDYLTRIGRGSGEALRVTDKLLTNYYFVGLIHILFPNARIIHTTRNPFEACVSTWTKLFKDEMPHTYDLGELGRYYREYERLMAHWHQVLPEGRILKVAYEDVVADLEGNARRIIEFCGLPWDEACLAFHRSKRPVKTASVVEVRRPIYDSSVERWRRYEQYLKPLTDELRAVEQG